MVPRLSAIRHAFRDPGPPGTPGNPRADARAETPRIRGYAVVPKARAISAQSAGSGA
jgi:hypothetical protein